MSEVGPATKRWWANPGHAADCARALERERCAKLVEARIVGPDVRVDSDVREEVANTNALLEVIAAEIRDPMSSCPTTR